MATDTAELSLEQTLARYDIFRAILRIGGVFYTSEPLSQRKALAMLANQPANLHSIQGARTIGNVQVTEWETF